MADCKVGIAVGVDLRLDSGLDEIAVWLSVDIDLHKLKSRDKGWLITLLEKMVVEEMCGDKLSLGNYYLLFHRGEELLWKGLEIIEHVEDIVSCSGTILFA